MDEHHVLSPCRQHQQYIKKINNILRESCFNHQQPWRNIQERVMGLLMTLGPYPASGDRLDSKTTYFVLILFRQTPQHNLTRELTPCSFPFLDLCQILVLHCSITFLGKPFCEVTRLYVSQVLFTFSLKLIFHPLIPSNYS